MRLRVRNFQAISDARLDVEGLTVVTGKSNTGKTALIRATAAMLFGLPGDHFVRRGEDWTGGALEATDPKAPLKIAWRKVPQARRKPNLQPLLEINGVSHTKLGRDHKLLTAPHGIAEIECTATRLRPQVAMQHDPIFLVGENETTCAEVFKLLGRVDTITNAQTRARSDLRAAEQRRKLRTEDKAKAEARRDELKTVPALNAELATTRTYIERTSREEEVRERGRAALTELGQLTPRHVPPSPSLGDPGRPTALRGLLTELGRLAAADIPTPPGPLIPPQTAREPLTELTELETERGRIQAELLLAKGELEQTEHRIEQLKATLAVCPTCGQPFTGGTR